MENIIPGVYRIRGGYVSAYVIDGDEGVTLVDTLLPKREELIQKSLAEIGRSLADVTAIVLTHSHADHAGSAAAVEKASGALVYASAKDAPAVRGDEKPPLPPVMDRFPLPLLKPIMRLGPAPAPVVVDHLIGEGGTSRLPEELRAIDTPGHTPGHTSFLLDREGGLLVVGDAAVAKNGEIRRGYFNRPEATIDASLRHIAELDFDKAVFGHSDPIHAAAAGAFRRFVASMG